MCLRGYFSSQSGDGFGAGNDFGFGVALQTENKYYYIPDPRTLGGCLNLNINSKLDALTKVFEGLWNRVPTTVKCFKL